MNSTGAHEWLPRGGGDEVSRPSSTSCDENAWSSPIEGSENRCFHAVLQMGGIKSPADAVRAAIVAETRAEK